MHPRGTGTESPAAANIMRVLPASATPRSDDLKAYWRAVHGEALQYLGRRPLTLVRSVGGTVFFHRRGFPPLPDGVHSLTIEKREGGKGTRLWVDSLQGLLGLVDLDVVEIHPWQATVDDIERADLMVLDLDPGAGVPWRFVTATALALRDDLAGKGLE